jgi:hypothetical protein
MPAAACYADPFTYDKGVAWYTSEVGSSTVLLTPYGPYSNGSVFLGRCDGSQVSVRAVCGQGKWVADATCKVPAGGEHGLGHFCIGIAEVRG